MTSLVTEPGSGQVRDAVVVGGGPAGLFAALTLARGGLRPLLVESGGSMQDSLCPRLVARLTGRLVREVERFRLQCPRCTCLTGLGGAAFHFDTNLGYVRALSRSKIETAEDGSVRRYSGLERAVGSFDRAQELIRRVYGTLHALGLPPPAHRPAAEPVATAVGAGPATAVFANVDTAESQSITVDDALVTIANLRQATEDAGGEFMLRTRATGIRRDAGGTLTVTLAAEGRPPVDVRTRAVVVGTGKLGLPWIRDLVGDLGIAHSPAGTVDVGVRLETSREAFEPLVRDCHNPKLSFLNERGESVRTFCVCEGGRIMQYRFEGAVVLDGQHCLASPTGRSNVGIVTTVRVPRGVDGTAFATELARDVTRHGGGRPVVCQVDELRGGAPAPPGTLSTSLIDYRHAPLSDCLPATLVADVREMLDRLDGAFPGLVNPSATVAAPVIERVFPALDLSPEMESSVPNVFFVGDASSKIIGITYGAATGMVAAESILRRQV